MLVGGNTPFLLLLGVGLFLLGASLFLQGCCNEGPGSQPGGNCGEFLAGPLHDGRGTLELRRTGAGVEFDLGEAAGDGEGFWPTGRAVELTSEEG